MIPQGNISNGPYGLTLQAWALCKSSGNTIVKGGGVASISGGGSNPWIVTLSAPMLSTDYLVLLTPTAGGASYYATVTGLTLATFSAGFWNAVNSTWYNPPGFHLAVFA